MAWNTKNEKGYNNRINHENLTKCIFQSGVGAAINGGFSLHSSVLADVNALRNPLRNNVPNVIGHLRKNEDTNLLHWINNNRFVSFRLQKRDKEG